MFKSIQLLWLRKLGVSWVLGFRQTPQHVQHLRLVMTSPRLHSYPCISATCSSCSSSLGPAQLHAYSAGVPQSCHLQHPGIFTATETSPLCARGCSKEAANMATPVSGGRFYCVQERKYAEHLEESRSERQRNRLDTTLAGLSAGEGTARDREQREHNENSRGRRNPAIIKRRKT